MVEIVREYDDLPVPAFIRQAPRDCLAMQMIERGYRVIEDDPGIVVGGGEFGEKRG